MSDLDFNIERIFKINSSDEFNDISIKIFQYQAKNNAVYSKYLSLLGTNTKAINHYLDIPFLPIDFFKTHNVICGESFEETFLSSGTTQQVRSKHFIKDTNLYIQSFLNGFELFYGNPQQYCFIALLPNYLEQGNSSLVYMVKHLIEKSEDTDSGFFLNEYEKIREIIKKKKHEKKKCFIIGVTYALLDFSEENNLDLSNSIVMETGGMKGRKKEMVREEVHKILCENLNTTAIHSEYGMTELLSQAYSKGNGIFEPPPWMKVLTRSVNDPFSFTEHKSGTLNIIDLANVYSCSFIATQDIGKLYNNNTFEVLGRIDNSDTRGCSLMIS